MIFALAAIGLGLIVALGGTILLGRHRHGNPSRKTYALSTVVGIALVVAGIIAW